MKTKNKEYGIVILRAMGMFMIVACHISTWLEINALAQLLSSGVQLFLLISGYLYANRKIDNTCEWIKYRWMKICIPMYIYILFILVIRLCTSSLAISKVWKIGVLYVLNLQGFTKIIEGVTIISPGIQEAAHLWFLTIIMICYIIMAIIKKCTFKVNNITNIIILIVLCTFQIVLVYSNVQISYFLTFYIGYSLARYISQINYRKYSLITLITMCIVITRLLCKEIMDGTILYDKVIAEISLEAIAIWIFITIFVCNKYYKEKVSILGRSRFIGIFDEYSYSVYIVHYMFLTGVASASNITYYKWGGVMYIVIFTLIASFILQMICKWCIKNVINIKQN